MKRWQQLRKHPELWPRYFIREQVLTAVRTFFEHQGFHEVETPLLTGSLPPESYLEVFETSLLTRSRRSRRAFLPTSPEPFLKKLLVAGIGNCFTLTKSFRNTEDMSLTHTPEFSILEWYRTDADYTDIMRDCEDLVLFIRTYLLRSGMMASTVRNQKQPQDHESTQTLRYQGRTVDISRPWERLSVVQAFKTYAGIGENVLLDPVKLKQAAIKFGYTVDGDSDWEELFNQIFLNEIEPHLGQHKPTILYDYPIALAALARPKPSDARFAERFEFYIRGLELGDAYSELTDWREQAERFRSEQAARKRLGKTVHPVDEDFITALKAGMPRTGGIAVGIDRLIMLFSDARDIADTMLFPPGDLFPSDSGGSD